MGKVDTLKEKIYRLYLRRHWKAGGGSWLLEASFIQDYKDLQCPKSKIRKIHSKGFTVTDWFAMNLDENDYRQYISSAQYYGMHPINGMYSKWIDDKLTLKYICKNSNLNQYLPEYYFMIDGDGKIIVMDDLKEYQLNKENENINLVVSLLKNKGILAVKMLAGSIGEGFYCAKYENDKFYMNSRELNEKQFMEMIKSLKNYLIIEYLKPHSELAVLSSGTANCLRYCAGRINGHLVGIKRFIRFGTKDSGFVENYGAGGVLCYIDENGYFKEGNIYKNNKNNVIYSHPDNGEPLKGRIPLWDEIEQAVKDFDNYFPQLDYLGFDFVVTDDNKVKILEINSLTSLDTLEVDESLRKNEIAMSFFGKYLGK